MLRLSNSFFFFLLMYLLPSYFWGPNLCIEKMKVHCVCLCFLAGNYERKNQLILITKRDAFLFYLLILSVFTNRIQCILPNANYQCCFRIWILWLYSTLSINFPFFIGLSFPCTRYIPCLLLV